MRILNYFKHFALLAVLAMAIVACEPDTSEDNKTKKEFYLELTSDEVMQFTAEGGSGEITWEQKLRDVTRSTPYGFTIDTDAEWITISYESVSDCRADITVSANDGEARECKVVITYLNYFEQVIEVTIKQAGVGELPQPETSFAISVQEVHAASAITQVTPADEDMYYVMFLEEVSYMQNGNITTAEQLWEDDYMAFEGSAIEKSMNLKEYMVASNIVFKGAQRVQWNRVRPGVNSVLYVYGVEFSEDGASYEPVTNIAWTTIKPDYAPLQDVTFGLDVKVSGADVELDIETNSWNGYYLVKIVDANDELYVGEGVTFDDDYMKLIADEWVATLSSNLAGGHPLENILEQVCYKGDIKLEASLDSYVLYSALVYPVAEYDGFYQVVGKPSYINFSTEEVTKSDMEIDIEVTNCYVRVADLKITSTNPDETYVLLITPTSYLPAGYDDQTLLDYALGEFSYYTYEFKGEITSHLNTLYPNTEYIVVTFGYSGGVVTTDVYSEVFKTQKEGKCELEVTDVVVGGPYRPTDLYNYDPETFKYYTKPYYYDSVQFIVTLEVKTSAPTRDIFSYFVSKDDYEWGGYDTTFYDLLIDTCDPLALTEGFWDYGAYYACAAAFDYKGDVTPMWMSDLYSWTMDDFRPIEEFVEKWEARDGVAVMGLSAEGAIVPMNKLR
ncbi:MAG: BACON domain-containing protein [Alistipes sp.]|nr:BACON domain-containing protein [Alistipes sp.]